MLIPKGGQPSANDDLPKVRPICLLSELGKVLERIIVDRLKDWMRSHPGAELSECQYGFREGKSTCDALQQVKQVAEVAIGEGGVTIAISLDISNAFNSVPWRVIRQALEDKGFLDYLRRILDDYLHDRSIEYLVSNNGLKTRRVKAGVPQGSVLGPLLWNIAFDSVLQEGVEIGCRIICYASDTLILASADTIGTALARANLQTALVLNRIKRLGLTVSASKTEAMTFHGKVKPAQYPSARVANELIEIGNTMKYLGVILDSRLTFRAHFEYVEAKASKVTRALGRLMPNLKGLGESKRRLYAKVLLSVI